MKKIVVPLLLSVPKTLFAGYILAHMWTWFIVPKFGLPSLTTLEAVGLLITVSFLTDNLSDYVGEAKRQLKSSNPELDTFVIDTATSIVITAVVLPLLFLSTYVWHLFIGG